MLQERVRWQNITAVRTENLKGKTRYRLCSRWSANVIGKWQLVAEFLVSVKGRLQSNPNCAGIYICRAMANFIAI